MESLFQRFSKSQSTSHINARTPSKNPVAIHLVGKEDIDNVGRIWRNIEKQCKNVSINCNWNWVKTWIDVYGDQVDYWFFVGMVDGKAKGIIMVTRETHRPLPLPVKAYHIGTHGEPYSDRVRMVHNTVLVLEKYKKNFFSAFLDRFNELFQWEELVLDDFNSDGAAIFKELLSERKYDLTVESQNCRLFDLEILRKNKTSVMENLGKETRHSIRRSMKALGDITTEWAETPEQALDILNELITLYQKHWTARDKKGMFASERFTRFQKEIISKTFHDGSVIMFRVKSKQYGTIGCLYLIVDKGVGYGYQCAFNDFEGVEITGINRKRLRPGFVVHELCIEECLKRGINAYNFSIGEYPYKKELTNADSEIVTIAARNSIKPVLRDNIMNLYLKMDDSKQLSVLLKPIRMLL